MNGTKYFLVLGLLISTHVSADYDPYGSLFTSPDQRARLDKRFAKNAADVSAQSGSESADRQTAVVQPLRLNGTLISSVGKKQVWINGRGQMAIHGNKPAQVRLLDSHNVAVRPAASNVTHMLKPGQTLDPSTGQISEGLERSTRP